MARRLLLLFAAVRAVALASGAHAAKAENRLGALLSAANAHTGPDPPGPRSPHQATMAPKPGIAAGCCVAHKGCTQVQPGDGIREVRSRSACWTNHRGRASGLRSGSISPGDLPVEVIRRGGETLALNTRSTLALHRGGVDAADWTIRDVTGNAARERLLTRRLARNNMSGGSDVIRITGAGRHANSTR